MEFAVCSLEGFPARGVHRRLPGGDEVLAWLDRGREREEGMPESTGVKAETCSEVRVAACGNRSDRGVACYGGSRVGSIWQGCNRTGVDERALYLIGK